MRRFFSTLFLFVAVALSSFAQRNYAQELVDLVQQGRCFEAREFRRQYSDYLPKNDKLFDLLYNSNMALYFNKPDSAIIYLEDMLTNHEFVIGPMVGSYYGKLLQSYEDLQQFDKGIELCDRIVAYFNRNPFDFTSDFVREQIESIKKIKSSFIEKSNAPQIRIERNKSDEDQALKLKESDYIRFNANYNGIEVGTWFDTGVTDYFIIYKGLADEIGVKITDKVQDSIKMINGVPKNAYRGVIDSIDLGSVKLYNVPVMVFLNNFDSHLPDTLNDDIKSGFKSAFNDKHIIMGLLTMKMIGKIEFDRDKRTVSFPKNTKDPVTNNSSNIFFIGNNPYMRLKINGLNYVGHLDTGADDFLILSSSYYDRNKTDIPIDTIIQKKPLSFFSMTSALQNVPHEIVKDAIIYSNGKQINQNGFSVLVLDRSSFMNLLDGIVGVNFFKMLGRKVSFDFDNMKVEGIS